MRKALAVTIGLERQGMAESRQALAAIEQAIAACDRTATELEAKLSEGMQAAWALPGGPRLLAAYITRLRLQQAEAVQQRRTLEGRRAQALAILKDRLAASRSLEMAADHLRRTAAREIEQREAASADEAAMLRHGHARRCGRVPA